MAVVLQCWVVHSMRTAFCPSLAEDWLLDQYPMYLFVGIVVPSHCRIHGMFFLMMVLALLYRFRYVLFDVHLHFDGNNFLSGLHTFAIEGKNFPK